MTKSTATEKVIAFESFTNMLYDTCICNYIYLSLMATAKAQRRWRQNNDYKSLPSYQKLLEKSRARWKKKYHCDIKFKKSELERQREYYKKNREEILAKRKREQIINHVDPE